MPADRFTDRVVFITGGTSGLGLATTKLFAAEGAKIFVTDLEERDVLKSLPESASAHFARCDVASSTDCENAINACVEKFGRLDVLFHCAGGNGACDPVTLIPVATWEKTIQVNLTSVFYLCRVAIPVMAKQGKGSIVSIASTSGLFGDYGMSAYNAAKAGVINLTKSMAVEHAQEGIRINAICPGYMITPMTTVFSTHPIIREELLTSIPMGRGSQPSEVAKAALYLASDDASYTTGTALVVDGGWTSKYSSSNFSKHLGSAAREKEAEATTTGAVLQPTSTESAQAVQVGKSDSNHLETVQIRGSA